MVAAGGTWSMATVEEGVVVVSGELEVVGAVGRADAPTAVGVVVAPAPRTGGRPSSRT